MSKSTTIKNLAIIMDGNGRWAKERGLIRTQGHSKGIETIRNITIYGAQHPELESITFYAFSTENWKRPKFEVDFLMKLLEKHLEEEIKTYQKHNVRFLAIGDIQSLSKPLQKQIKKTQDITKDNKNLTQILALNYGGRQEIVSTVNMLLKEGYSTISEENISKNLQTPYSDIDLLVRTSGEERISNFLLWQLSYSEFYFSPTYWPDFSKEELDTIIKNYKTRTRRFGGLK